MRSNIISATPVSTTYMHQHSNGDVTIQTVADVTKAVNHAKELHNTGKTTTGMGDKHVASIPIPVLTDWAQKRGKTFSDMMQDQNLMKQFLEDPDNSVFRIWKGAL